MKRRLLIHHLKPLSLYTWGGIPEGYIHWVCLQHSPQMRLWLKHDWKAIRPPITIPKDKCLKLRLNSFLRFLSETQFLIAVFIHFCRASCFIIPVAMNLCSTSFQQYTNIQVGQLNMFNFGERSIFHLVCCSITFLLSSSLMIENLSRDFQQTKKNWENRSWILVYFVFILSPSRHLKNAC